eukprot:scaffold24076_cov21-Tisochrysis_lutea.AAC.1
MGPNIKSLHRVCGRGTSYQSAARAEQAGLQLFERTMLESNFEALSAGKQKQATGAEFRSTQERQKDKEQQLSVLSHRVGAFQPLSFDTKGPSGSYGSNRIRACSTPGMSQSRAAERALEAAPPTSPPPQPRPPWPLAQPPR